MKNNNYWVVTLIIIAPGPGSYRLFSEWGIYESKNANQASSRTNYASNDK